MNKLKYYKQRFNDLYLNEMIRVSVGDRVVVATGMTSIANFEPAKYAECTVINIADEMVKLDADDNHFWCDLCLVVARVVDFDSGHCGSSPARSSPCSPSQKDVPEVQTPNVMSPCYAGGDE